MTTAKQKSIRLKRNPVAPELKRQRDRIRRKTQRRAKAAAGVLDNRAESRFIGRKFKIQGRPTMTFRVIADKTVAGFRKLWGVTLDNKYSTVVGVKEAHFID